MTDYPTLTHQQFGEAFVLYASFGTYENGRLAVQMIDTDYDEPFATVTVNLPDHELADGEHFIKNWSENEAIVGKLLLAGWLQPVGHSVLLNGYLRVPVMRLAGPLLEAYDLYQHR